MKLYYMPLSGHAHRAHLFLSLIGVAHELVPVDIGQRAHKTPEFLGMNRFGQIPVLDDDGTIVSDSNAIHPTIADVALYSYTARAPEGNVDLSRYPHVIAWLARIEALPGFVPFPRTAVGLSAVA